MENFEVNLCQICLEMSTAGQERREGRDTSPSSADKKCARQKQKNKKQNKTHLNSL